MGNRVILPDEDFPITPADIDTKEFPRIVFARKVENHPALLIVRLMQRLRSWQAFSIDQINEFSGQTDFQFFELGGRRDSGHFPQNWWPRKGNQVSSEIYIATGEDGKFYVTDAFILRCYYASPIPRIRLHLPLTADQK